MSPIPKPLSTTTEKSSSISLPTSNLSPTHSQPHLHSHPPSHPHIHTQPQTPTRTIITLHRTPTGLHPPSRPKFKNTLLASVGYLELANAGDFAANVWNQIPVPTHAVICMAIFGPIALLASLLALRDLRLALANLRILRTERTTLSSTDYPPTKIEKALRELNTRQLLTETIDRALMDVLLGFGAVLVGVGTIMAIFGAQPAVFVASNLLSGFVGNAPAAVFGVVNAVWAGVLVRGLQKRWRGASPSVSTSASLSSSCLSSSSASLSAPLGSAGFVRRDGVGVGGRIRTRLRTRFRMLQAHAAVNGITGLVAGMASMVTARMWWGYVVLLPCVAVVVLGNWFWRVRLGYDRAIWRGRSQQEGEAEKEKEERDGIEVGNDVVGELMAVMEARETLDVGVVEDTLEGLMGLIVRHRMAEAFCERLTKCWQEHSVFAGNAEEVRVVVEDLLSGSESERARMLEECRRFLQEDGRKILENRERYLLELLGELLIQV